MSHYVYVEDKKRGASLLGIKYDEREAEQLIAAHEETVSKKPDHPSKLTYTVANECLSRYTGVR